MNIPEEQITHSANCVELTGVQQLEARDTYNILGEIGRNWGENDWSNTTHHNKATVVLFRGEIR